MAKAYGLTESQARRILALIGESGEPVGLSSSHSVTFREPPPFSVLVVNKWNAEIPAFGVMQLSGVDTDYSDRYTLKAVKPTSDGTKPVVVNGPIAIPSGDRGICFSCGLVRAAYKKNQTLTPGMEVGVDGFEISNTGTKHGYIKMIGVLDTPRKLCMVYLGGATTQTGVFPVKMVQTGGADGSATVQASWTYKIRGAEAVTDDPDLATEVNPGAAPHHFKRFTAGKMSKADYGMARYVADPPTENPFGLEIIWCNEVLVVRKC